MSFTGSTVSRYSGRWLMILGVSELLLAGLFLFLAFTVPGVEFGFYLAAAILGITGVVLLLIGLRVRASAAATDRLLATGLSGQAQVVGLTQTGVHLNQNPQVSMELLVELPGREPYPARRREFVPLILLGRLTSGATVPVKVDPADPQRVALDWQNVVLPEQPAHPAQIPVVSPDPQVANTGHDVQTTARVDRLEDSGRIISHMRLFTMELTVNVPGGSPTRVPANTVMVPLLEAHKLAVGIDIPVRYSPGSPGSVTIDWDGI